MENQTPGQAERNYEEEVEFLKQIYSNLDQQIFDQVVRKFDTLDKVCEHLSEFNEFSKLEDFIEFEDPNMSKELT